MFDDDKSPFEWQFSPLFGYLQIEKGKYPQIKIVTLTNLHCVFFTSYGVLLVPPYSRMHTEEQVEKLQGQLETALLKAYKYLEDRRCRQAR